MEQATPDSATPSLWGTTTGPSNLPGRVLPVTPSFWPRMWTSYKPLHRASRRTVPFDP